MITAHPGTAEGTITTKPGAYIPELSRDENTSTGSRNSYMISMLVVVIMA